MSRHLVHYVANTFARPVRTARTRRGAVAVVAAVGALLAVAPAQQASADVAAKHSHSRAFATCDGIGKLTMTGGHARVREHTVVDRRGRSHVFFTVVAQRITLADADGTNYRFTGSGYDYVVYPHHAVSGDIVREDEVFRFDVTSKRQVVGVIRFHLHSGPDGVEHVHQSSTCTIPGMA